MLDRILERALTVSLITACALVSHRMITLRRGHANPGQRVTAHAAGRGSVEPASLMGGSVASIRPRADNGGVLLFVSPACPFCEESIPFYRRLLVVLQSKRASLLVAVATRNGMGTADELYVLDRGLAGAVAVSADG